MSVPLRRVAPLLFLSGLCALVYQVAWLRELRLIFGASTAASAAVLAVFMGGLGVGGWVLGRLVDQRPRPLALYANLELLVAMSSALTPLLTLGARGLYLGLGGTLALGTTGGTIVRLLSAVLVLGVPTFLMGGTLPAAARAVSKASDPGRRGVAVLYAVNTLGAVVGAFATNFLLLEVFGTKMTLWMACLINALVGMVARALSRLPDSPAGEETEAAAPESSGTLLPSRLLWFPPTAAAVAGFSFLLMELVWYRMLSPILGGSSYSFGLILCIALAGIGLGGALYPIFGGRRVATLGGFAWTCALEAIAIIVPLALGDKIALLALVLRPFGVLGFWGHVLAWTGVTAIVVFPAALVSGYQFPLIISLFGRGGETVGKHVGIAYATNTLGSIAGSLAGGFGLLPFLTAPGCWRGVGVLLAVAGLLSCILAYAQEGRRLVSLAPIACCALVVLFLRAQGPTAAWRHGAIGAGRSDAMLTGATRNSLKNSFQLYRRSIVWEAEGVESSVALNGHAAYSFLVNGKSDGNARMDAPTQVLGGLLGAALLPTAHTAFVVGLGTGSTAGWLGSLPTMERVEVAEIEPVILRVARDCAAVNQNVLDNPKVHITLGDAREILLTSRGRFDIIFSEPSNPYRAGISSLYTQEFYQAAKKVLAEGGVFLQWLQMYDIDGPAVRSAIVTLSSVFPTVSVWQTTPGDLVLVASDKPLVLEAERLRDRLQAEPFRSALIAAWRMADLEGFLAHHVANPEFARRIAEQNAVLLNTDDNNLLEYALARNVGRGKALGQSELWQLANDAKLDRPESLTGRVDWDRVEARRVLEFGPGGHALMPPSWPPSLHTLYQQVANYRAGNLSGVRKAFRMRSQEPETPEEIAMVAEALAYAKDETALPLIEKLKGYRPSEALALHGLWLTKQGKAAEAAKVLQDTFVAFRSDPWPPQDFIDRTLELAVKLCTEQPDLSAGMFEALAKPFSINNSEQARQWARLQIGFRMDFVKHCQETLAPYEPYPLWSAWLLARRVECYRANQHRFLQRAEEDLIEFQSLSPSRLRPSDEELPPEANPRPPQEPAQTQE